MPRVKRGVMHTKKRKRILKQTKGYKWGRKNLIKEAITATNKAGVHAFVDRKKKKRVNRRLWQIRLNAALRPHELSYSKFIKLLKDKKIELDRKVLSNIAKDDPSVFTSIITEVKK